MTGLDRLRSYPNVVVFCTTNIDVALDSAFTDRVFHKQAVLKPQSDAIYHILRNALLDLVRTGVIDDAELNDTKPVEMVELLLPTICVFQVSSYDDPNARGTRLWAMANKLEVKLDTVSGYMSNADFTSS